MTLMVNDGHGDEGDGSDGIITFTAVLLYLRSSSLQTLELTPSHFGTLHHLAHHHHYSFGATH